MSGCMASLARLLSGIYFHWVEGLAAYFLVFSHFSVGCTSARVFPVVSITHSQVICLDFMFKKHK